MQERFLEGRTALVTGFVQGIGLAIAKALASAGATHGTKRTSQPIRRMSAIGGKADIAIGRRHVR